LAPATPPANAGLDLVKATQPSAVALGSDAGSSSTWSSIKTSTPKQNVNFAAGFNMPVKNSGKLISNGKVNGYGTAAATMALSVGNAFLDKPIAQTPENQKFLEQSTQLRKQLSIEQGVNKGREIGGEVAMSSGNIWAMAAAAADYVGRATDKGSKDPYGVYKSKLWEAADVNLDPAGNITDLFTGDMNAHGVANLLGAGWIADFFGEDPKQAARRKARDTFLNTERSNTIAQSQEAGARTGNMLPRYSAPAYGRAGLKIRTKFSK
jgi:hypothetical protein